MQTGEYIVHRLMVEIIRDICKQRGIEFATYSDDWVLEMKKAGKTRRVIGYRFSINDSASASIAQDKVATHLLLERAGVSSVPHVLLRPKVSDQQRGAIEPWGTVVVKPLEGSGGHHVRMFTNADEAIDWIESTSIPAWAAAPFVDIEREIRLILLDGQPLIVYEKQPTIVDGLKMFNLGLGATPKNIVPDADLLALAVRAQTALGLRLSAVDIAETANGERLVLEVNSGFMMENYIRSSPDNKQRAVEAYGRIIDAVMT